MSNKPLVSVLTPTTHDRLAFNNRIKRIVNYQDYPNLEHILVYGNGTIGAKRNTCCKNATGSILVMFDSDDYYAPDYISKCVSHLNSTGADVTGLSNLYFYRPHTDMWEYKYEGRQPYVVESGMCIRKSAWETRPFTDTSNGENMLFLPGAGLIVPHDYKEGMLAIIHGKNTCSSRKLREMDKVNAVIAKRILSSRYDLF